MKTSDITKTELPTNSHDVHGICNRAARFIEEALKCQSANVAHVNEYDLERLKSYIAALINYRNWVVATPQLDCPETHPMVLLINCPDLLSIDNVENASISDWCRLVYITIAEMANSQSSRTSSGLISHDLRRFDDYMAKLSAFLEDYVEVTLPLDLPESSPSKPGVTAGKTGI